MDIKELRTTYGEPYNNAYYEIKILLRKYDFYNTQGSVYLHTDREGGRLKSLLCSPKMRIEKRKSVAASVSSCLGGVFFVRKLSVKGLLFSLFFRNFAVATEMLRRPRRRLSIARASSALRSPSTTLYLIINPIYLPLKHNDYEQNMENNSADYWLRHCRHPRCSW